LRTSLQGIKKSTLIKTEEEGAKRRRVNKKDLLMEGIKGGKKRNKGINGGGGEKTTNREDSLEGTRGIISKVCIFPTIRPKSTPQGRRELREKAT